MRTRTIVIGAAAALMLTGCGESDQKPEDAAPTAQVQTGLVAPAADPEQVIGSYPSKYAKDAHVRQCLAQSAHSCISMAVQADARKGSDPEICEAISETNFRSSCKNMVAMTLAAESGNAKPCAALPDGMSKRECVIQAHTTKARKSSDTGACSDLTKALPLSESGSGTKSDSRPDAWTKNAQADAVDRCMSAAISESAKQPEACEKVSNPFFRKQCESAVLMRNSVQPGPMPIAK